MKLCGNRLDKLFQMANDSCSKGLPVGPVVSDIASEIVASAVDRLLNAELKRKEIECEAVRYKDDYRILVSSEADANTVVKLLQASLKEYHLELSDEKTMVSALPDGLFRPWRSRYHLVDPAGVNCFTWKQFRELCLAVVEIDRDCPNTGVIDRFLADITTNEGKLKIKKSSANLRKVVSMLLIIVRKRAQSFPKVLAIIEQLLRGNTDNTLKDTLVSYLEKHLLKLSDDELHNQYLISWIVYFLASNGLLGLPKEKLEFKDLITKSSITGKGTLFDNASDFKLIEGVKTAGKRVSLFKHLEVFNPPKHIQ